MASNYHTLIWLAKLFKITHDLAAPFLLNPPFRNKPFVYIISQIITRSYVSVEKLTWQTPITLVMHAVDVVMLASLYWESILINSVALKYFWGHNLLSLDMEKLTTVLHALRPNQSWFIKSSFWRYVKRKCEALPEFLPL